VDDEPLLVEDYDEDIQLRVRQVQPTDT
jgi:hypothetical protein